MTIPKIYLDNCHLNILQIQSPSCWKFTSLVKIFLATSGAEIARTSKSLIHLAYSKYWTDYFLKRKTITKSSCNKIQCIIH